MRKEKEIQLFTYLNGFYDLFMYAKTFSFLLEPSTCSKLRSVQFGGEGGEYFTHELYFDDDDG